MPWFGDFTFAPKSTEKQVAELKEAWLKANEKSSKQMDRYKEMVKFTNALSEAYINNVKVTIDVSNLLNAYTDLLTEISKGINQLQENMDTGLRSEDIERLKNLTLANIDNINNVFKSGFEKVNNAITAASATPDQIKTLEAARSSIDKINTSAIRSTLSGGRGYRRPVAKPKKPKAPKSGSKSNSKKTVKKRK